MVCYYFGFLTFIIYLLNAFYIQCRKKLEGMRNQSISFILQESLVILHYPETATFDILEYLVYLRCFQFIYHHINISQ